jgi:adhesin transport system outer membrane protein
LLRAIAAVLSLAVPAAGLTQEALPPPSGYPLKLDLTSDPILKLRRQAVDRELFRAAIAAAVARHPAIDEAAALEDEAETLIGQAKATRLPSIDAGLSSYRVIARAFSNDQDNIIERSRAQQRTDATVQVQQLLFDFGASAARVRAAGARLRGAQADTEDASTRVALSSIAAWYDIFGYRALVGLTKAFLGSERDMRRVVAGRIAEGVNAQGDLARVDSYIAQTQTRLARFQRQLANAEARFTELTGAAPPAVLERAPAPATQIASRDEASDAARAIPVVRSAEAAAAAAQLDARAARADRLPQVNAGIDAGRYGVFETERDYDIRGRLSLRWRLFGGVDQRAEQFVARARAAEARAARSREEASRDAATAWADVQALEQQLESLEAAYIASRRSRDVIAERFQAARGTLFDLIASEEGYFEGATAYVQGLTELDAARYVLLSRTGRLLDLFGMRRVPRGANL